MGIPPAPYVAGGMVRVKISHDRVRADVTALAFLALAAAPHLVEPFDIHKFPKLRKMRKISTPDIRCMARRPTACDFSSATLYRYRCRQT